MRLNRDFQEYLNEELLKAKNDGVINEYYDALYEALNRDEKDTSKEDMQDVFRESVQKTGSDIEESETTGDNSQNALDGEDELIVGGPTSREIEEEEEEISLPSELGNEGELSDEELDEKYPQDDLSKNAKRYALSYERIMQQYYKLKLSLEKENIRKGQYSYDDRHFSQLMTLKSAAISYEIYFRNATHGKYFAVRDAIDSIKDMEEKNEIELKKFQDENNRVHEKQNMRVEDLIQQINSCLKRIEELNNELQTAKPDEKPYILNELRQVQDKYIELNKKLELIRPNPKELAEEEYRSKSQNDIEAGVDGIHYSKYVNRYADESPINNPKYNRKEKERGAKEEKLDSNGALSSLDKAEEKINDAKKESIESIDKEIESGNLGLASELLDSFEKTYGNDFNDKDELEVKKVKELKNKIDETIKNNPLGDRVKPSDQLATEDASDPKTMEDLGKLASGERVSEREPDLGLSR